MLSIFREPRLDHLQQYDDRPNTFYPNGRKRRSRRLHRQVSREKIGKKRIEKTEKKNSARKVSRAAVQARLGRIGARVARGRRGVQVVALQCARQQPRSGVEAFGVVKGLRGRDATAPGTRAREGWAGDTAG